MQILWRRWVQASSGEGHAVLLCGEPGIGKSRLVRALEETVLRIAHVKVGLFCSPHRQDSALFPVIEYLEHAAGIVRTDAAEQKLRKLKALLERDPGQPEEIALIAELLSMPVEDSLRQPRLSPQKHREQTLKALVAYVIGLATQQPVLMVFEDVQWIDPTSLELLSLLIERMPHQPILLLITARPEFTSPWSDLDIRVTTLPLTRLSRCSGEALVRQLTAGKSLPSDVQEQILARTDGVPLFIEELTKSMLESGLLVDAGDHYTAAGLVPPLAIPETLHASLLARLDRLAPVREVAQIGAALGCQFSYEMISAVALMSREHLDDALDQLIGAGLIQRSGSLSEIHYVFKHPLVQDAVYGTLLRGRRQQIHGRIASMLEERFQDIVQTHPELLAHHYTEAGNLEAAIPAWLSAGRRALERSALTEAVAQFNKGLTLLCGMRGDTWRRQELDLRIALGRALIATQGHASPATGEAYARARELSEKLNRPPQFVPVLYGQCVHHLMRAELEVARAHAREMQHLGETQDDVRLRLMGCRLTGQPELYLGEFAAARAHLEQGLALFDPSHRSFYADQSLQDARVMLLGFLSQTLFCLGYPDQARRRWEEALMEARQLNQAYTLAVALGMACALEIAIDMASVNGRNPQSAATPIADELVSLSTDQEFPMLCAMGTLYRGWCLTAAGQEEEGFALLDRGLDAYRAAGTSLWTPFFLSLMADAHLKACRPEQGMKYLDEATGVIDDTQERWVEAEVYRLRGELTAGLGDPVEAEACFRRALVTAERQDAKLWKLRAATGLARLWRNRGRCDEARDLLTPIYNWFTEGFAIPDMKEAGALINDIGGQAENG
jgi:predicted ATPase/ABC-type transport system involved in cytochrome c biogenesis ATPase subunit